MKILIWSQTYLPNLGGIETTAQALAEEFVNQGHQVRLLTRTKGGEDFDQDSRFTVIRTPSRKMMWETVRWCDVCLHNGLMRSGLGLLTYYALVLSKPYVLLHQFFLFYVGMRRPIRMQYYLLERFVTHVYLCEEMQQLTKRPGVVLGNPYRASLFREIPGLVRETELVYLGRLVRDKGVRFILEALALLKQRGRTYKITLIGDGAEKQKLRQKVEKFGLTEQVNFVGVLRGQELVEVLNQHKVMIIPSTWKEPFGIVALEGIACGCVPLTTGNGGLIEAVGPCGLTFPNKDVPEMARLIELLLEDEQQRLQLRSHAQKHLEKYTAQTIAQKYLQLFDSLIK